MTGFVPDIPGESGAEAALALLALYGLCDQPKTVFPRPVAAAIDIWAEPDVCGWPDEGPRDDPARVAAWCAAVCRRNADRPLSAAATDSLKPSATATQPSAEASGADWLEQGCRQHGVIPSGHYDVEILPRGMRQIATAKTSGVSFLVGIVGGQHDGTECRLNFLCDGPEAIVRRDLGLLKKWGETLGVGRTPDAVAYAIQLGLAGEGRRIALDIESRATRNGIELACVSVEVGGPRDG